MDYLLTIFALLVIACFTRIFLVRGRSDLPLPPGPPPRVFTKNLHDIPTKQPWLTYTEWGSRYGGIVHAEALGKHIIILNSYKVVSDLLEKRSHIYSDRPYLPMVDLLGWGFVATFMPYGSRLQQHRRIFQKYFRREQSKMYYPVQIVKIRDFLRALLSNPENFREHWLMVSGAIIMKMVYDIDIKPINDRFVTISEKAIEKLSNSVGPGAAVNAFPFLRYFPGWLPGCGFQRYAEECCLLTQEMQDVPFDFTKKRVHDGRVSKSILAALLETNEAEGGSCEQEQVIKEVTATAYAGGADTTVSSMATFFLAMATHPDCQTKAQEEIDSVIGTHRLPEFDDRSSLPYVEAVYREVMRWKPVAPLIIPHATTEDDVYEGYFIPKGSTVLGNIWAMTRDTSVYGADSNEFNPERYFNPDGKLNDNDTVLAFGFGRRICPGRYSAGATVWATIVSVLATFRIAKAKDLDGNEIDIDPLYSDGLAIHPEPFRCSISPRTEAAKKLVQGTLATDGQ
ncbi:cytochrome P450 [Mycena rebaudengoi]|nr:cytochrome P450 [Mycena rebaudengoi]